MKTITMDFETYEKEKLIERNKARNSLMMVFRKVKNEIRTDNEEGVRILTDEFDDDKESLDLALKIFNLDGIAAKLWGRK